MNHREFENLLSEYLDGELTGSNLGAIESHLGGCAACKLRLAELKTIQRGIKSRANVELPPSFSSRVLRTIRL